VTPAQDAALWKQKAESVRGDRHSENETLRKICVTNSGLRISAATSETNWKATYHARVEAERQMRLQKEGGH